jgi:hypothetical protein
LASRASNIFARRIGCGHTRGISEQGVGAAIGLGGETFVSFGFFRPQGVVRRGAVAAQKGAQA